MQTDRCDPGSAIKLLLEFPEGADSVILASGTIEASCSGNQVLVRGEATLDLLPRRRLHVGRRHDD